MIIKLPVGVWARDHEGGTSLVVLHLFDDSFDVHIHRDRAANPIPDGRRATLAEAMARADEYLAEIGHTCSSACGEWVQRAGGQK